MPLAPEHAPVRDVSQPPLRFGVVSSAAVCDAIELRPGQVVPLFAVWTHRVTGRCRPLPIERWWRWLLQVGLARLADVDAMDTDAGLATFQGK